MLAYATRHLAETRLRVRDLATGVDRDLGPAPLDLMNGAAWLDLIPRYDFTPDGKAILIAWRGRIERRPLDSAARSEEHTSELQSLMRISYAVFCLKKKKTNKQKAK